MYLSVSQMTQSSSLSQRISACAAVEQTSGNPPAGDPETWTWEHRWDWASTPGWSAAWDSAVAGGVDNPGADDTVITDGMILSRVQELAGT